MTDLTAVSLFAGVGGFDLALERNGIKVVAAAEIDKNARTVLTKHFPHTKLFEDVAEVTGDDLRAAGFIPERGIITGGFPCQDLSVAGKRAGLDGARSGLFWEIVRLLDETQPKWFVIENVPGLLTSNNGRDMGTVVGTLVECGYGIAYRVLDSQFYGIPQRRRRVFIVGHLGDNGTTSGEILALPESLRRDSSQSNQAGKDTSAEVTTSVGSSSNGIRERERERERYSDNQGSELTHSESKLSTLQWSNGQKTQSWYPVVDVAGPLTVGDHVGGARTVNGQDAYSGQLLVREITQSAK